MQCTSHTFRTGHFWMQWYIRFLSAEFSLLTARCYNILNKSLWISCCRFQWHALKFWNLQRHAHRPPLDIVKMLSAHCAVTQSNVLKLCTFFQALTLNSCLSTLTMILFATSWYQKVMSVSIATTSFFKKWNFFLSFFDIVLLYHTCKVTILATQL